MTTATGVLRAGTASGLTAGGMPAAEAASASADQVLQRLGSGIAGLSGAEAARRLRSIGPNAVRSHHARALPVLARQFKSAILLLLIVAAVVSAFVGERADAVIIGVILAASVGLGFVNEYRAERAAEALHSQVRHDAAVLRDGAVGKVSVVDLVPGDVVRVALGELVPADLRLLDTTELECDEAVLTGESMPVEKGTAAVAAGTPLAELSSCALMGTVVQRGRGTGVVVATGARAEFGRIAVGLGDRQPETDFQRGLRRFSLLLLYVAATLMTLIFLVNVMLRRPLLDALLFSLAIAVGITPQLLPTVVSTSLATGARQLARRKVLVKRLVCIEDLGDLDILITDKTGTLTEGEISYVAGLAPDSSPATVPLTLGLLAADTDAGAGEVGANPLDRAIWRVPQAAELVTGYRRLGQLPFDHERRRSSAVVQAPDGSRMLIVKGAPEAVLSCCGTVPPETQGTLTEQFSAGSRVIAIASRPVDDLIEPGVADEQNLILRGLLIFLDRPKLTAPASLARLAALGISVKVATGDNPLVASKVFTDLGLDPGTPMTGPDLDALDDAGLATAAIDATIFARVSPEQKARLVRVLRSRGRSVGFLGDGVNDALALHASDVGISVDSATDVAKDAADIVLLEKDLGVLADGVSEGRRIFANTIKYVLMGTSSNFGNMFSAAAASAVLTFLPMLPSQLLLNNLLYDAGQLTIPTDHVDEEQLRAPAHWDIGFIRRFMISFGPLSSLFDFLTFAVMIGGFRAGPDLFRSGWFVESLATQTLVIFAIRTRRVPFFRSRPSAPLTWAAFAVVAVGIALPMSPLRHVLGFASLPLAFFLALAGMVLLYLMLIEFAKSVFFEPPSQPATVRRRGHPHRVHRRAARFSVAGHL
jgi:Mg2+-importing ATPase